MTANSDSVPTLRADALTAVQEFIGLSMALSTERNLRQLLRRIVELACRLTGADGGRLFLVDRIEHQLVLEIGLNGDHFVDTPRLAHLPLFKEGKPDASSIGGYCTFFDKPVNLADVYKHTGFDCTDIYEYDESYGYRTQSILAIPLRSHDGFAVGVLQLSNLIASRGGRIVTFPKSLEDLVRAFASQAAVVVENARLLEENQRLISALDRSNRELTQENIALRKRVSHAGESSYPEIIGSSQAMRRIFRLMDKVRGADATVLILGETGTGKELVAEALHRNGRRKHGPFVVQNCASVPEALLEAELFGYRRGAFTGAVTDRKGLIEAADKGTLFLDEIGDMPLGLQAKLLRVLQDRRIRPLGGVEDREVDVRFIAATHRALSAQIAVGQFREDLYYRLSVFPIELPPLCKREEDVALLLGYYLKRHAESHHKSVTGFAPAALDKLLDYGFPGNVRELRNIVERAVLLCEDGGTVLPQHLPDSLDKCGASDGSFLSSCLNGPALRDQVQCFESNIIKSTLQAHRWNQTEAARALSISRRTLIDKMHRYNLTQPQCLGVRRTKVKSGEQNNTIEQESVRDDRA